ncbi:potassium-transporting ATPase subunit C [Streptomyces hirsutus]|uniref:potassium-transporting ATPase subunit C n=1 Tax=Streptomyces hirsutus TaxID=35620 RepID=UPI003F4CCC92
MLLVAVKRGARHTFFRPPRNLPDAFRELGPRVRVKSPVVFVVLIGSILTTVSSLPAPGDRFGWTISARLRPTVLFANLAEAVAEGRGKAQADTLRRARTDTVARRRVGEREEPVPGTALRIGDLVVCEAGDIVPGHGDVVEGVASVDESAPVIRESGGDRSAVTSSGSGLGPDISPAYADFQVHWIAERNGLPVGHVHHLTER